MGNRDLIVSLRGAQFREPTVSKLPCSHLYADSGLLREPFGIEGLNMNSNSMRLSPFAHKRLVPITLISTKIEVAMGYSQAFTRITADKDFRHTHGINAAANCQKSLLSVHYLLAIVQVKPNRSDSLNCTLCLVSPSFSLKIITLSS